MNVRNFIQKNYTPYLGDGSFLAPISTKTEAVWKKAHALIVEEVKKGIIDVETHAVSGIDNFAPGYIDRENEVIVGLQTDAPLKRIVNPFGGIRNATSALEQYGYQLDPEIEHHFRLYRKTHNEGVFDAYPKRTRLARSAGLLTGLPDAYGRGRIVGDYRRVPLYGTDFLIEEKEQDLERIDGLMTDERIRLREEVQMQIRALKEMAAMAARYGCDITRPAENAREAVQNLYMAYLAGIKENNGAATSLGRTATFLDIYIQRDLDRGLLDEQGAQELIDQFVIKLRLVRHLRTPEYNELFGGDPTWVTESIGGMGVDGRTLVTKNSFRYLDTLVERLAAFGVAGLSIAADSLSAIKFAQVRPIRDENGIAVDFQVEGDFPKYGNDDDRVDDIAVELMSYFSAELKKHPLYRNAIHTLSALTITSNVMYGKKTGATPDGRKAGEPFAPGANPMHGRDKNGALASLNSVAKIPYRAVCQDGVSNTFSIVPAALGKSGAERVDNLVSILDGYFRQGAHHLNVNVMNRQLLLDAMEHPEQYPTLTIRVSGYAVNFARLSREQQLEVIKRTFHDSM